MRRQFIVYRASDSIISRDKKEKKMYQVVGFIVYSLIAFTSAQTRLSADGTTDAYALINQVFGKSAVEPPDCLHKVKHITTAKDNDLNRNVFLFHIHLKQDGDSCKRVDRQRNEIKTVKDELVAKQGETVYLSWNVKLDRKFQASQSFSHIHQVKDVGGKSGTPIITLSPRKGKTDVLQVIHVDSSSKKVVIGSCPLDALKGQWIHVEETYKCGTSGSYSLKITKLSDGSELLAVNKKTLDMWRPGAEFLRPKWGIYRGLDRENELRDEILRYDSFCVDKGKKNRCF